MQAIGTSGIWLSNSPSFLKFHAASTALMLVSGGDRRIVPDPVTGRNRYGTLVSPAEGEISFASTTASNISTESFRAAGEALERLIDPDAPGQTTPAVWFGDIRQRMKSGLGANGSEVVLAASGTDLELLALALVTGLSARPLTNIVIAPDETGSGVPRAAAGFHYSDLTALGDEALAGTPVDGMAIERIDMVTVFIRDPEGRRRHETAVDADVIAATEIALKQGYDVLLHVLDTSKTGLSGVSRAAARHAAGLAPGRVHVIVDACQFRCPTSTLRADLDDGFMVAVTGSKFLAGPPFAGALLIPQALASEFSAPGRLPLGFASYCAGQDWPMAMREKMNFPFGQEANVGLGLRWIAALEHLDGLSGVDAATQLAIRHGILSLMRERIAQADRLFLHADDEGDHIAASAILPFSIRDADGRPMAFEAAQAVHVALREGDNGPVCHVGQAVKLGRRAVLRLAVSAPDLVGAGRMMQAGLGLDAALAPVAQRLDVVFDRLSQVLTR
ncbi:MAG: hypothetical protein PW791_03925 [Neorhizobium sp.]|nr:hypothetical protein [Neorhizobium sp.]